MRTMFFYLTRGLILLTLTIYASGLNERFKDITGAYKPGLTITIYFAGVMALVSLSCFLLIVYYIFGNKKS